jgi:hypothetical protein
VRTTYLGEGNPGVVGRIPGVVGRIPGVAGRIPGVAGRIPGVAGGIPEVVNLPQSRWVFPIPCLAAASAGVSRKNPTNRNSIVDQWRRF